MQTTQRHIHSLWLHTIVVITLHPLHSWHHTPYIWHHTHGNTNVISAIWPTISNTTSTLSMSSNPGYQLHDTHCLYDITHTIRVTSYSVCMLSQQLFMTLYASRYNITPSIFMTSYSKCTLTTYCFHDNTSIPDISPTIFGITATVSLSSPRWHTHLYRCITLSMTSQQVCKSSHLAHIWHHTQSTSHSHFMTSMIMFNDITNTAFMISDLLYVASHPLFRTSHHFMYDIKSTVSDLTSTVSLSSHRPYRWYHSHYVDGLTTTISVTSYLLYLGYNIH